MPAWYRTRPCPASRRRTLFLGEAPAGQSSGLVRLASCESEPTLDPVAERESASARFIVEELLPYSQPETHGRQPSAAARRSRGRLVGILGWGRRVFHAARAGRSARSQATPLPGRGRGLDLRHQWSPGSSSGGGLVAVGAGPAQLLRFARGDLIRLSFEEGLSEQVAVLVDDWVLRVGQTLGRLRSGSARSQELRFNTIIDLRGSRFRRARGCGLGAPPEGRSIVTRPGSASRNRDRCPFSGDRAPLAHGRDGVLESSA